LNEEPVVAEWVLAREIEIVADSVSVENLLLMMKSTDGFVYLSEKTFVDLRPPNKVTKVHKGADSPHHTFRDQTFNGREEHLHQRFGVVPSPLFEPVPFGNSTEA
jgi:hypothetical protein